MTLEWEGCKAGMFQERERPLRDLDSGREQLAASLEALILWQGNLL